MESEIERREVRPVRTLKRSECAVLHLGLTTPWHIQGLYHLRRQGRRGSVRAQSMQQGDAAADSRCCERIRRQVISGRVPGPPGGRMKWPAVSAAIIQERKED